MAASPPRSLLRRLGRLVTWLVLAVLAIIAGTLGACRWHAESREARTRLDAAPSSGHFVRAGDVDVFIQERGSGPVVLFMHGMGAWSEIWRPTLDAVANAGF